MNIRKHAIIAVLCITAVLGAGVLAWGNLPEAIADSEIDSQSVATAAYQPARTMSQVNPMTSERNQENAINQMTEDDSLEAAEEQDLTDTEITEDLSEADEELNDEISDYEDSESSEEYLEEQSAPDEEESPYEETPSEETEPQQVYEEEDYSESPTIDGYSYSNVITCTAYAYVAGGYGASGNPAVYGTCAVDPSVIPLGTRLYIEGYGFAIANDTGGNIVGCTVDLVMDTTAECYNWGVRTVNVYILD